MKLNVEIDLSRFVNEDGGLDDFCRDEIVTEAKKVIIERFDRDTSEIVKKLVPDLVEFKLNEMINDILNHEIIETTSWGEVKSKMTVRDRILKTFEEQVVYKRETYSSNKNGFTAHIDSVVDKMVKDFQSKYNKLIDEMFTNECFNYAQKKLQDKLGVK